MSPLTQASHDYRLALQSWEEAREAECGLDLLGRPERGEAYTLAEGRFREAHPAPVWRDFVKASGRAARCFTAEQVGFGDLIVWFDGTEHVLGECKQRRGLVSLSDIDGTFLGMLAPRVEVTVIESMQYAV